MSFEDWRWNVGEIYWKMFDDYMPNNKISYDILTQTYECDDPTMHLEKAANMIYVANTS